MTYDEVSKALESTRYEGYVVKSAEQCEKDNMVINLCVGKLKKKVNKNPVTEKGFTPEMQDEIDNEFNKHPEYYDMSNKDVVNSIFEYLGKYHPSLFLTMNRQKARDYIKQKIYRHKFAGGTPDTSST